MAEHDAAIGELLREYRDNHALISCLRADLHKAGEALINIGNFLVLGAERIQVSAQQVIMAADDGNIPIDIDLVEIAKIGELTERLRKAIQKERQFEERLRACGFANAIYP